MVGTAQREKVLAAISIRKKKVAAMLGWVGDGWWTHICGWPIVWREVDGLDLFRLKEDKYRKEIRKK